MYFNFSYDQVIWSACEGIYLAFVRSFDIDVTLIVACSKQSALIDNGAHVLGHLFNQIDLSCIILISLFNVKFPLLFLNC